MSDLDLLALIPEKFRTSELLTDLLEVVSDKLVDFPYTTTNLNRIYSGHLQTTLTASATEMTLQEDHSLPLNETVGLMLWDSGTPSNATAVEFVTATSSTTNPNVFTIERARHNTTAVGHTAGSNVVLYSPLSLKELFDKVDFMENLINPRTVPADYLQNLADLVGATLQSSAFVSEQARRNELLSIIDWYKAKGSYHSIQIISYITGLNFKFFDLYTNDYETFLKVDWFVGNEGENPPWHAGEESGMIGGLALDDSYYKSPHFGLYIKLNLVYKEGPYVEGDLPKHIWRASLFGQSDIPGSSVAGYIEKTRPVNTVPHYGLYLECPTDLSGRPFIVYDKNKEILTATVITDDWGFDDIYFDQDEDSDKPHFDDGGHNFDTSMEAFLASIIYWKVGTDGKLLVTDDVPYTIDTPRGGGSGILYRVFEDRFEFYLTLPQEFVPEGDTTGITELGLYQGEDGPLVVLATFPALYKDDSLEVYVKIIVYKTKDPYQYTEPFDEGLDTVVLPDTIKIDVHCVDVCEDVDIEQDE